MTHQLSEKARDWMISNGKPPVTAAERQQAREMRDKGMTLAQIAQKLGRVPSTVHNMLKR